MDAKETNNYVDSFLGTGFPKRIRGRVGVREPEYFTIDPYVPGTRDMMRSPHVGKGGGENDWSLEYTKRRMQKT